MKKPKPNLNRARKIAEEMDADLKAKGISATISTSDGKTAQFGAPQEPDSK